MKLLQIENKTAKLIKNLKGRLLNLHLENCCPKQCNKNIKTANSSTDLLSAIQGHQKDRVSRIEWLSHRCSRRILDYYPGNYIERCIYNVMRNELNTTCYILLYSYYIRLVCGVTYGCKSALNPTSIIEICTYHRSARHTLVSLFNHFSEHCVWTLQLKIYMTELAGGEYTLHTVRPSLSKTIWGTQNYDSPIAKLMMAESVALSKGERAAR